LGLCCRLWSFLIDSLEAVLQWGEVASAAHVSKARFRDILWSVCLFSDRKTYGCYVWARTGVASTQRQASTEARALWACWTTVCSRTLERLFFSFGFGGKHRSGSGPKDSDAFSAKSPEAGSERSALFFRSLVAFVLGLVVCLVCCVERDRSLAAWASPSKRRSRGVEVFGGDQPWINSQRGEELSQMGFRLNRRSRTTMLSPRSCWRRGGVFFAFGFVWHFPVVFPRAKRDRVVLNDSEQKSIAHHKQKPSGLTARASDNCRAGSIIKIFPQKRVAEPGADTFFLIQRGGRKSRDLSLRLWPCDFGDDGAQRSGQTSRAGTTKLFVPSPRREAHSAFWWKRTVNLAELFLGSFFRSFSRGAETPALSAKLRLRLCPSTFPRAAPLLSRTQTRLSDDAGWRENSARWIPGNAPPMRGFLRAGRFVFFEGDCFDFSGRNVANSWESAISFFLEAKCAATVGERALGPRRSVRRQCSDFSLRFFMQGTNGSPTFPTAVMGAGSTFFFFRPPALYQSLGKKGARQRFQAKPKPGEAAGTIFPFKLLRAGLFQPRDRARLQNVLYLSFPTVFDRGAREKQGLYLAIYGRIFLQGVHRSVVSWAILCTRRYNRSFGRLVDWLHFKRPCGLGSTGVS